MVARVTMKAGIFTRPMSTPVMGPRITPIKTANRKERAMLLVLLNTMTVRPPTSASWEPTDRSMSPVRMMRPIPRAMMPMTVE